MHSCACVHWLKSVTTKTLGMTIHVSGRLHLYIY